MKYTNVYYITMVINTSLLYQYLAGAAASESAMSDLQMLTTSSADSSTSQQLTDLMLKSPPAYSMLDDQLEKLGSLICSINSQSDSQS